ncbi:S8 family serine peptidase [Streptomyces sp. CAU 1734]|uniref:S8 family peptidase n=1 Tax=Streptomyces sp. CAU 1734 TaxID=3140360 RepID=UPI003260F4FC
MTAPAAATGQNTADRTAVDSSVTERARPDGKTAKPAHRITLITGDRVSVDTKGKVVGIERAKGREGVPIRTSTHQGRTSVVPLDAQRLISSGKLDRRLFDITGLSTAESRESHRDGLKLIVGYRGTAAKTARAKVRAAGDTEVRRSLASLNADAVTTPADDSDTLWRTLTRPAGEGERTTSAGIGTVWLDGVRKATLNKSVAKIGAPKLWNLGYDGTGVKIAVLDTGVDATHPDLRTRVVGAKNFTSSPDTKDRVGHGTHVASTAAGTGVKSAGKYKGVAPGATVLNGKVLDDGGSGDDSGIVAGIDWAVAQGADIINMSLSGWDSPELDPIEARVNEVTADHGILFAIAAGNAGPDAGSVGSPGSAEAALTVGAVDDADKIAEFSSAGPLITSGGVKPDVTAPGVDTTAAAVPGSLIDGEYGQNPPGYTSISGTSMATPHVAGAAALLKQKNPDWTPQRLKSVLAASAVGGPHTAFQQGTGRIAVDKAVDQTVFAEQVSVNLGVQQWPHTDDTPVSKAITYRNSGTSAVTLDLAVTGSDPTGKPAPAGFFTLGANRVTVPPGSTATVDVTADTTIGGTVNGAYSATVTGTGGGQTVRATAAVNREVESYNLTLTQLDRAGAPTGNFQSLIEGQSGEGTIVEPGPAGPDGKVTVRVPKGQYLLESFHLVDATDLAKGLDWFAQPRLTMDRDTAITLDARTAKPVAISVPDPKAVPTSAVLQYEYNNPQGGGTTSIDVGSFAPVRTAHLGPEVTDGSLSQYWSGQWSRGALQYNTIAGGKVRKLATGYTKQYKAAEFATLKVGLGSSVKGKKGALHTFGTVPGSNLGFPATAERALPEARTVHVTTAARTSWELLYEVHGSKPEPDGFPSTEAYYMLKAPLVPTAGKIYKENFNTAVHSPLVDRENAGVHRHGSSLWASLPVFADGQGHYGDSAGSTAVTTLHRGKTKIGQNTDPLTGQSEFTVGAADAAYTLKSTVKRPASVSLVAGRVDVSWTFRSKKPTGDKIVQLPVSTARFGASVGLDSRVPAGVTQSVPLTVHGAAAGANLKSLQAYASYDGGKTWKTLTVKKGKVSIKNPAKSKAVSLRAKVVDKKGNTALVTVYNAYFGK